MRTPAGEVVMDPTGRLAGRGAYLCADGSCWHQALAKGALQRALAASLPPELRATLQGGAVRTAGMGATIDESAGAASLQASAHRAQLAGERKGNEGDLFGKE